MIKQTLAMIYNCREFTASSRIFFNKSIHSFLKLTFWIVREFHCVLSIPFSLSPSSSIPPIATLYKQWLTLQQLFYIILLLHKSPFPHPHVLFHILKRKLITCEVYVLWFRKIKIPQMWYKAIHSATYRICPLKRVGNLITSNSQAITTRKSKMVRRLTSFVYLFARVF